MQFTASIDGDNLYLSWDEKSPHVERDLHELGGAWEDFNSYRFRFDEPTAKKVLKYAKTNGKLAFASGAKESIKEMVETVRRAERLTRGDADAEVPQTLIDQAPETAKALRSYQRAGVAFISSNRSTLLADDPGSGKTLQTIASMIAADVEGDILVLAPSIAVQVTWPAEISRWSPNDEVLRVVGTRKQREKELAKLQRKSKAKRRWVLCNIEMAKTRYHKQKVVNGKVRKSYYEHTYPELFYINQDQKGKRAWDAIVVDESHRALITKKSRASDQTLTRCGMGKLLVKDDGLRVALSGTPFRGKPENLWGTLNWLFPDKYTSFWKWVSQWFETNSGFFGGTEISELADGRKEDFYKAIQPFTLRRTKSEIAPDLPPKSYAGNVPPGIEYEPEQHDGLVGHWLDMSTKQKRAYREMEEYATAALENGTLVANGVLSELTRLKQFATSYGQLEIKQDVDGFDIPVFKPSLPSNKFDWLVEFLDELGIDGSEPDKDCRKVVIASQFTSIIDVFAEGLEKKGIDVLKITGKVSAANREAAVKAFQQDTGPQVLMLNTMAGGVALTLDRADDIVILDETFIPDDQTQVEDRVHRVSRNHNVTVHYVRSIGTVEERIAKLTYDRDSLQKQLIDGSRGVNIARKIVGK